MLKGVVCDCAANPLAGVSIEVKNEHFETIYSVLSNENGRFAFEQTMGKYPFLTAVKSYAKDYLEFWASNIDLSEDTDINIKIGDIELYGMNTFTVKGAESAVFIYFRPMSLKKYKQGAKDIAPDITDDSISVKVNNNTAEVLSVNKVNEYGGGQFMTAYLLQARVSDCSWKEITVELKDADAEIGMAAIFNG